MARTDHGAVPERAVHETGSRTFGPGRAIYLHALFWLLLAGGALYALLAPLALSDRARVEAWFIVAAGVILTFVPVFTAARYRLDAEGVERRTLNGRRRWPWEAIGGVRGRSVERSDHFATTARLLVCDTEGQELFRISVWTGRRRELAREISRRARAQAKR